MAIKSFLNSHHVFNRHEFNAAFFGSVTDANLLARAINNGKVRRVRHGLYVSQAERFAGLIPSGFEIADKAVDDAVFCYLSALQLYGVLHNESSRTQFYTRHRAPRFDFAGQEFHPYLVKGKAIDTGQVFLPNGTGYQVTTREQTLVDCLYRVSLAGGAENALRSLAGFKFIDGAKAARLALRTNKSVCARLGWVFECMMADWGVGEEAIGLLQGALASGPYYFYSSTAPKDSYWAGNWKLYLPYPEEEMRAWLRG